VPNSAFSRLRGAVLAALLTLAPLQAQVPTLVGATRQQIYSLYGEPTNRLANGAKEVLTYKQGRVVLENGVVVEITLPVPPQLLPTPIPTRAPAPTTVHLRPGQPISVSPGSTDQSRRVNGARLPARPPENADALVRGFFVKIATFGILLALLSVAGAALSAQLKSRRRTLSDQLLDKRPKAPPVIAPVPRETPSFETAITGSPTQLTTELLNQLEWRRFEMLVTAFFNSIGHRATRSRVGADGGVDVYVYRQGEGRPFACVQCKAWHTYKVGVKPVRELFGVMAAEGINEGFFATTGQFTEEAREFASGKALSLLTGDIVIEKVNALPDGVRTALLRGLTEGDYTTPTCPSCDVKMVLRTAKDGEFWGCPNYGARRCRQTFKFKEERVA